MLTICREPIMDIVSGRGVVDRHHPAASKWKGELTPGLAIMRCSGRPSRDDFRDAKPYIAHSSADEIACLRVDHDRVDWIASTRNPAQSRSMDWLNARQRACSLTA